MSTLRDRAESLLKATPTPTVVAQIRKLVEEARKAPRPQGIGTLSDRQLEALSAYAEAYHAFRSKQFEAWKAYALITITM